MAHVRPSQNEFEECEMVHVRKGTEANDLLIGTDEPDVIEGLAEQKRSISELADKGYYPRLGYLSIEREANEMDG